MRLRSKLELEHFAVEGIKGVCYVPEWLSHDEEQAILERVYAVPDDSSVWVKLKRRRLQMWGGEVKTPFRAEALPAWLLQIVQALVDAKVFSEAQRPNHALINGAWLVKCPSVRQANGCLCLTKRWRRGGCGRVWRRGGDHAPRGRAELLPARCDCQHRRRVDGDLRAASPVD